MSICALMVASALAGTVDRALSPDVGSALESLMADFQQTLATVAAHGSQSSVSWSVPSLPSGSVVHMSFTGEAVLATGAGLTRVAEPMPGLHLWVWDGAPLNATRVEELDRASPPLDKRTGDTVSIRGLMVQVDDCDTLLLFVA